MGMNRSVFAVAAIILATLSTSDTALADCALTPRDTLAEAADARGLTFIGTYEGPINGRRVSWQVEEVIAGDADVGPLQFRTSDCAATYLTPGERYLFSTALTDEVAEWSDSVAWSTLAGGKVELALWMGEGLPPAPEATINDYPSSVRDVQTLAQAEQLVASPADLPPTSTERKGAPSGQWLGNQLFLAAIFAIVAVVGWAALGRRGRI